MTTITDLQADLTADIIVMLKLDLASGVYILTNKPFIYDDAGNENSGIPVITGLTVSEQIDQSRIITIRADNNGALDVLLDEISSANDFELRFGYRKNAYSDSVLIQQGVAPKITRSAKGGIGISWQAPTATLDYVNLRDAAGAVKVFGVGIIINAIALATDIADEVYIAAGSVTEGAVYPKVYDRGTYLTGPLPTHTSATGFMELPANPAGKITYDAKMTDRTAPDIAAKLLTDETMIDHSALDDPEVWFVSSEDFIVEDLFKAALYPIGWRWRTTYKQGAGVDEKVIFTRLYAPETVTPFDTLGGGEVLANSLRLVSVQQPAKTIYLQININAHKMNADELAGGVANPLAFQVGLHTREITNTLDAGHETDESVTLGEYNLSGSLASNWQKEVDRVKGIYKRRRYIYKVDCLWSADRLSLGDIITFTYPGLAFESGAPVMVIGKLLNPLTRRIELMLWG